MTRSHVQTDYISTRLTPTPGHGDGEILKIIRTYISCRTPRDVVLRRKVASTMGKVSQLMYLKIKGFAYSFVFLISSKERFV